MTRERTEVSVAAREELEADLARRLEQPDKDRVKPLCPRHGLGRRACALCAVEATDLATRVPPMVKVVS